MVSLKNKETDVSIPIFGDSYRKPGDFFSITNQPDLKFKKQ